MILEEFKTYIQNKTKISDDQFEQIADGVTVRAIKKGEIVLLQEAVCSEMFFVSKGLLRSYTIDKDGKEHVIQFAPEDWWIGDRNSFYFSEPSLFFIDAVEDSTVVVLNKDFFVRAEQISPSFGLFNVLALHNTIRYMQKRINCFLSATAEERYLDFVQLHPNLTLRVPQWMIASYLGITPESLSRVRKGLATKNFTPI
jgi:CRP-like cAMP-binding protein